MKTKIAVILFVSAIVAANLLVAWLGPWVSPLNAFFLIGLDLSLRDWLHEKWRSEIWRIGALIAAAGVISYLLNPAAGRIAVASTIAFVLASAMDALVYHRMIELPWLAKANASNVAGSATDSIAFPVIAFGWSPAIGGVIVLQFLAKVAGGAIWSIVIGKVRR